MKNYYSLILVLCMFSFYTSAQTIDKQKLIDIGIYPLESIKSEINYLDESWIRCKKISLEDINDSFSNLEDLVWIRDIPKDKKAVFIGENHFNKYSQNLRNRILFALNTFDYYPIIILEEPYSITAFANYYLQLPYEKQANEFYENELYNMIPTKEEYDLLRHIRTWNKSHPNKIISVGYEDVEKTQDELSRTINQIIIPYFQKLNPQYYIDWKIVLSGDFESLINELKQNLEKAKKINLIGRYPFITPQYISTVIDNLESSNNTLYKDYQYYRQKAIIRNLTDTNFLGKYLQTGKIVVHAGSLHMRTNIASDSVNNLWEGPYLTHVFELTKGKTYSIKVEGIARSLGEAAKVDSTYFEPALGFNWMLEKMQKAYKDGLINTEDCYFVSIYDETLNDYSKFWIQKGREYNWQGLLIESILWNDIIETINIRDPDASKSFKSNKNDMDLFDKVIIIPCSPLITPIVKINEKAR